MLTEIVIEPQQLAHLLNLIGSADDIAPVDDFKFAKRAGEMIARAVASMRPRTARRPNAIPNTANRKRRARARLRGRRRRLCDAVFS
jgi:hypothetical protein